LSENLVSLLTVCLRKECSHPTSRCKFSRAIVASTSLFFTSKVSSAFLCPLYVFISFVVPLCDSPSKIHSSFLFTKIPCFFRFVHHSPQTHYMVFVPNPIPESCPFRPLTSHIAISELASLISQILLSSSRNSFSWSLISSRYLTSS
jgi:hypothetical protein